MTVVLLVAVASAALAWANGANDVSKSIATLVGSGVTGYRQATIWGAMWTAAGAAGATLVTGAMLATFDGGLLGAGAPPTLAAAVAAITGAAGWVLFATRTGLPVSTTHAIVGAVAGAGVAAYGVGGIAWSALVSRVALPLALTPLAALVLGSLTSRVIRASSPSAAGPADCLCLAVDPQFVHAAAPVPVMVWSSIHRLAAAPIALVTRGDAESCAQARPQALQITADQLHWLSSGAVSFARGLNDAPKIVALALAAAALAPRTTPLPLTALFAIVTVAMVAGSLAGGRRVTRVLAEDVTPMNHREGLAGNGVTALLVTVGAVLGLPMSTTHVSFRGDRWRGHRAWISGLGHGAIDGIGLGRHVAGGRVARCRLLRRVVSRGAMSVFACSIPRPQRP